jgi:hypothetical protein
MVKDLQTIALNEMSLVNNLGTRNTAIGRETFNCI